MEFKIRDTRRRQMFQVDDEYLSEYARLCGPIATCVYLSLCRHANKEQSCWPSIKLIQEELALGSHHTVVKALRKLVEFNIVSIKKTKDEETHKQKVNIYTLLDKSFWKLKPTAPDAVGADGIPDTKPTAFEAQKPTAPDAVEGYTLRRIHTEKDMASHDANDINRIFQVFYDTVNKHVNFGNKTSRKAAKSLMDAYGIDEAVSLAKAACLVQGLPYAPTITDPYQLEQKLAALQIFVKRSQQAPKGMIHSI